MKSAGKKRDFFTFFQLFSQSLFFLSLYLLLSKKAISSQCVCKIVKKQLFEDVQKDLSVIKYEKRKILKIREKAFECCKNLLRYWSLKVLY